MTDRPPDAAGDDRPVPREEHSPVLLTGYSQGTPISVAIEVSYQELLRRFKRI